MENNRASFGNGQIRNVLSETHPTPATAAQEPPVQPQAAPPVSSETEADESVEELFESLNAIHSQLVSLEMVAKNILSRLESLDQKIPAAPSA
jgi:hypothetical protein